MSSYERVFPLTTTPYFFIGLKAVAVIFGNERVDVKSWRGVYAAILSRCNQDASHHDMLMYLRNRASGKIRMFLSDKPDSMTRPLQIDDDLYAETHYGTQTLMHILTVRILAPTGFDMSGISIMTRERV